MKKLIEKIKNFLQKIVSIFRKKKSKNINTFISYQIDPLALTIEIRNLIPNTEVRLPILKDGKYDFSINWGDGSPIEKFDSKNFNEISHTYKLPKIHFIEITGNFEGWSFKGTEE
jgi:hypothetical protein